MGWVVTRKIAPPSPDPCVCARFSLPWALTLFSACLNMLFIVESWRRAAHKRKQIHDATFHLSTFARLRSSPWIKNHGRKDKHVTIAQRAATVIDEMNFHAASVLVGAPGVDTVSEQLSRHFAVSEVQEGDVDVLPAIMRRMSAVPTLRARCATLMPEVEEASPDARPDATPRSCEPPRKRMTVKRRTVVRPPVLSAAAKSFLGEWKHVHSDNYGAFLTECVGLNWATKKVSHSLLSYSSDHLLLSSPLLSSPPPLRSPLLSSALLAASPSLCSLSETRPPVHRPDQLPVIGGSANPPVPPLLLGGAHGKRHHGSGSCALLLDDVLGCQASARGAHRG